MAITKIAIEASLETSISKNVILKFHIILFLKCFFFFSIFILLGIKCTIIMTKVLLFSIKCLVCFFLFLVDSFFCIFICLILLEVEYIQKKDTHQAF